MTETTAEIIYEHPLNEQIRTYLRLENLFNLQFELRESELVSSHLCALQNLWEILDCLDRGDIKGEILKELELQKKHFKQLQGSPYIDELKLVRFLEQLDKLLHWINNYRGKFGAQLREDRFIDLIKHRIRIPGGSCSFDLPELYHFLQQPAANRTLKLKQYFSHLDGLYQCIKILMRLFRENGQFTPVAIQNGSYQHQFDKKQKPHLVRIKLGKKDNLFPEVSGSSYCFTVRFLKSEPQQVIPYNDELTFSLAIC